MASYVLINSIDGTVVDLNHTYLLNVEKFDDIAEEMWDKWLNFADDRTASTLATTYGVDLEDLLASVGYGDITYNNVIALSPRALRDEIEMLISGGFIEGTDVDVAQSLDDADLVLLCAQVMENDYLMDTFFSEIRDEIRKAISRKRIDDLITAIDESDENVDEMVKNLSPEEVDALSNHVPAHRFKDFNNRK